MQLQADREKYAYDYDNLQSQLDKSQGQLSRVQKEKETIQQELDRTHDKYDKHQVRPSSSSSSFSLLLCSSCNHRL